MGCWGLTNTRDAAGNKSAIYREDMAGQGWRAMPTTRLRQAAVELGIAMDQRWPALSNAREAVRKT